MTEAMDNELGALLKHVTKRWKQEKNRKEARENDDALTAAQIEKMREKDRVQSEKDQIKAAAYQAMPEAYRRASGNLGTCTARQMMYACRPLVLAATGGKCWKSSSYFTQRLLVDYQDEHEEECADWDITYDARGHLREPHAGESFGIGTVETRNYINGWRDGSEGIELDRLQIEAKFPTSGPLNRYQCAVFIEKEGFDSLVDRSRIAELYDVAFFSSKGQSTIATRQLVDSLSQAGVKILVLHDFDKSGLRICHWLSHDSPRYKYKVPPDVVDVGLRLRDVQRLKLESEEVRYHQTKHPGLVLCDCDDVTEDEIRFLVDRQEFNRQTQKKMWIGRRVELNAMTSDQFVAFLKRKIEENGIQKVVPDRETLKIAWRRAQMVERLNATIDEAMEEISTDGWTRPAPRDLATQVHQMFRRHPLIPWDEALARIAAKRGGRR